MPLVVITDLTPSALDYVVRKHIPLNRVVFDTQTLGILKTIEACDHPEGIEQSAADGAIYVACWGDNKLLKIDPVELKVTAKAEVGDGPRAFGKFLR